MSTILTKSSSTKVHSKHPYSDHSVEVGQLIPRFILSLSRLGKRRSRSTSWQERFRRVAFGVESNVGAPIAIYERSGRDDWIVPERSASHPCSPADDDRFVRLYRYPGPRSLIPRRASFGGNESFVKFQNASRAVVYSDLRSRQKFLRLCDMITLTVDGASEEK